LAGKTAVVTGASRGIGFGIAEAFAKWGAKVVAFARSPSPGKPYAVTGIEYRSADITNDMNAEFAELSERYGVLDILVNAAGVTLPSGTDEAQSKTAFEKTVAVNLVAAYGVCRAARPFMKSGGSIINVTSIGSLLGFPRNPGYVASKGGLRMMTKALALDYGAEGIRVNALVPGYIHTAMTHSSFTDLELHEQRRRHTCLGRWGTVDDLVGPAIFLASDASAYITGQDLIVDGGWTAKGLV
jgi:gluconate 5-dehydrogenase